MLHKKLINYYFVEKENQSVYYFTLYISSNISSMTDSSLPFSKRKEKTKIELVE